MSQVRERLCPTVRTRSAAQKISHLTGNVVVSSCRCVVGLCPRCSAHSGSRENYIYIGEIHCAGHSSAVVPLGWCQHTHLSTGNAQSRVIPRRRPRIASVGVYRCLGWCDDVHSRRGSFRV